MENRMVSGFYASRVFMWRDTQLNKAAPKMSFWKLRVAQGYLARRAVHSTAGGVRSGSCASRRLVWRGAIEKFKKDTRNGYLCVAQDR
ncbi:hypothetical protein A2U01_0050487 [Trifolium medium]|uniref:Uncharacterized protein n=1 Tax=Trifolium medium TaxID=97028 RepID=A0A392QYA1_9FABA|nr:hypothetical protein [Trifolium medium]